ncbi:unnamed protein product [Penicillium pancosmium]
MHRHFPDLMDRSNLTGRAAEISETDAADSTALTARMKLLCLLDELRDLLTDPALLGSPELRNPSLSILPWIRLKIFESFLSGGTTIKNLAQLVNRNENIVRRLTSVSCRHLSCLLPRNA